MQLKEALEQYIKADESLQKMYDEKELTINQVVDGVTAKARTYLDGSSGAVDDETVYGWCREFISDYDKAKHDKELAEAKAKREQRQKQQEDREREKLEKAEKDEVPKKQNETSLLDFC